jgi:hypothetical protein
MSGATNSRCGKGISPFIKNTGATRAPDKFAKTIFAKNIICKRLSAKTLFAKQLFQTMPITSNLHEY